MILAGCNSRKVQNDKKYEKHETNTQQTSETKVTNEEHSEGSATYKTELNKLNFQVLSKGEGYRIKYGGLEFVGNADIVFNSDKSKEEKQIKWEYWNHYTYWNVYKNIIRTTDIVKTHNKYSDRKSTSVWAFVLVAVLSILIYEILKKWIKSLLPQLSGFIRRFVKK